MHLIGHAVSIESVEWCEVEDKYFGNSVGAITIGIMSCYHFVEVVITKNLNREISWSVVVSGVHVSFSYRLLIVSCELA